MIININMRFKKKFNITYDFRAEKFYFRKMKSILYL